MHRNKILISCLTASTLERTRIQTVAQAFRGVALPREAAVHQVWTGGEVPNSASALQAFVTSFNLGSKGVALKVIGQDEVQANGRKIVNLAAAPNSNAANSVLTINGHTYVGRLDAIGLLDMPSPGETAFNSPRALGFDWKAERDAGIDSSSPQFFMEALTVIVGGCMIATDINSCWRLYHHETEMTVRCYKFDRNPGKCFTLMDYLMYQLFTSFPAENRSAAVPHGHFTRQFAQTPAGTSTGRQHASNTWAIRKQYAAECRLPARVHAARRPALQRMPVHAPSAGQDLWLDSNDATDTDGVTLSFAFMHVDARAPANALMR
jgi:hypothetical protein